MKKKTAPKKISSVTLPAQQELPAPHSEPGLPSQYQLARLTAELVTAGIVPKLNQSSQMIEEALKFWNECGKLLKSRSDLNKNIEANRSRRQEERDALPKPSKYPVGFGELLKLNFDGKTHGDRLANYRKWISYKVREKWVEDQRRDGNAKAVIGEAPAPTLDQIESALGWYQSPQWKENYEGIALSISKWKKIHASEIGKQKAKARWEKSVDSKSSE